MEAKMNTVDAAEIERFSRLSDSWWDPAGPMAPLHKINPLRVEYIKTKILECTDTLNGVAVLDIGCGAGLVCEPLARLGATVTGVDASPKNIQAARVHAASSGLDIDYRCTTAEDMNETFDVVLALEIIEHVADIPAFVAATTKLVKPGGLLIFSTINRTAKAFALAIVGAEYVLRWVPRGTHEWNKFVKPSELAAHLRANNIAVKEMTGMVMNPLTWKWELNPRDVDVNYLLVATKS
jgi:2-polyprenyl-6-hydroxyphenyl methylase/3-demethylubiquinone-9 3-methyltransferase